ncbi:MAG: VPLPA-CTERM sorting domain-containing protein [Methylococcales bacterium]
MKHLSKTLVAAALLATAGVAGASINTGSAATAEVYLSVYDQSQKLTFTQDLGVTMVDLIANIGNENYALNLDLSTNPMWNTFSGTMDSAQTVFAIAAGFGGKQVVTGMNPVPKHSNLTAASGVSTWIKNHANEINTGALSDNPGSVFADYAANNSSLVADDDTPKTGQHNNFNSLFSSLAAANANIPFSAAADFYYLNGTNEGVLASFKWAFNGSKIGTIPAGSPAPVPLPAAVWMFGAGLMGVFGLNRRKSAAV